ncbi:thiol:disulfide interchange protein DsbG [Achromobacter sp. MYb9]|uniref:thiol:disulfide interchange protein DsbG n=1 Tax=Achromobacter sp. MYb9 TaxID=1827284 RepID=UPI000CFB9D19|nr:thiol:disulfide interchange protein DsbG [Achromobacter sp. MYb9]PQZ67671.1 thiol:disulfide interchange protein DsbG [Achromobacter sp. MYb9]
MLFRPANPSTFVAFSLTLLFFQNQAIGAEKPAAIRTLEERGLTMIQEFDAGTGAAVRAFAGEALDDKILESLAAKPLASKTWAQLASATWVLDGDASAPRIVYTFTDPNCPYCNRFWQAARPWIDSGKVQIRHLLVGIIKADSPAKAAAILGASDRSAALRENEVKSSHGGIAPADMISPTVQQVLDANQMLMISLGFRGTPGIVVLDANGALRKYNGMPRAQALAEALGPL